MKHILQQIILFLFLGTAGSVYGLDTVNPQITVIVHYHSDTDAKSRQILRGDNGELFNFSYILNGRNNYIYVAPGQQQQFSIPADKPLTEVNYLYKNQDKISYYLHPGDTLSLDIVNGKPVATFAPKRAVDLEMLWRNQVAPDGYIGLVEAKLLKSKKKELEEKARLEIKTLYGMIDSLVAVGGIDQEQARLYKSKYTYLQFGIGEEINTLNAQNVRSWLHEDWIDYDFYRKFIFLLANAQYGKLSKVTMDANGMRKDERAKYDAVVASLLFDALAKDMLLEACMKYIVMDCSVDQADVYLHKFAKDVQDKRIYDDFVRRHAVGSSISNDVLLEGADGSQTTLSKLIQQLNGSPVYVDCWATWCVPCMAAMPGSMELVKRLRYSTTVFVYLSFDEDVHRWKEKVKEFQEGKSLHFRVLNSKRSRMLDDLHIPPIPRYLLYDKMGKLIYKNAPSPSTAGVDEVIIKAGT